MGAGAERTLPDGEVTMLFTDIEGSTRLASELGERYGDVLAAHRDLLREIWETHSGIEVGTEGDSFFVAFARAADAIDAAAEAQRRLVARAWPHGVQPRVRMGVHTGSPRIQDGDYWGIDVHRAARVMGVAYGGQVLLSHDARRAAGASVRTLDLGHHRLKDLPSPEHVFQLLAAGLPVEFPALRSLNRSNLPAETRPLIDRCKELALIRDALTERGDRLLTLTGVSGTGKTRLGMSAALSLLPAFPGGVFFVALADIGDPARVLGAIAEVAEVADVPGQAIERTLADALGALPTLVVLDNLERLQSAAVPIGSVLEAAPALRVLATSQVPLRISAERVLPLGPLAPEDAVALFADRAGALMGDYELDDERGALTELCERLDRLPLAIELAAARAPVLGPGELLARIDRQLDLLRDGAPDRPRRHQSLRAAVESSYELLAAEDRALLTELAQFVAPFDIDRAAALCGRDVLDGLGRLVDQCFVRRVELDGSTRFTIAQALRDFAVEQLERAGELDAVRRRHAEWALGVAEADWRVQCAQPGAPLSALAEVYDDMRAALAWAGVRDPRIHLELAGALGLFWEQRGLAREGREQLARALQCSDGAGASLARARQSDAALAAMAGEMEEAVSLADAAVAAARGAGDPAGEVMALLTSCETLLNVGRHDQACAAAEQAVALARDTSPELLDRAVLFLAYANVADGEIDRVEPMLADRLAAAGDRRDFTRIYLTHLHADCALQRAHFDAAAKRYAAAAEMAAAKGGLVQTAFDLQGLAMALGGQGRAVDAVEVDAMADALIDEIELRETAEWWEALRARHLDPARATLGAEGLADARSLGAQRPPPERVQRALELAGLR